MPLPKIWLATNGAEISRLYTHIDDKTKREAVNKLPVIGADTLSDSKKK